jgi:putative methyltransferase (TIGR04325 family)
MPLRASLKAIVPPFLWLAAKALLGRKSKQSPDWEHCPQGFAGNQSRGWDLARVAASERSRFAAFRAALTAPAALAIAHEVDDVGIEQPWAHNLALSWGYVLAFAARGNSELSVLDWGGGLGHSFLLARSLWPELALDYCVRDLPEMAKVGRELLPELRYVDCDADAFARRYQLVVASGSMHYAVDWRTQLQALANATSEWLYVTRLPTLMNANSYVFVQRVRGLGYDTEYLGWSLNRNEFLTAVTDLGFVLMREFLVDEMAPAQNAPEPGRYRGFLFKRAEAVVASAEVTVVSAGAGL